MGKINIYLEIAKETEELTLSGLDFKVALSKAKEKYLKEKAHCLTNQSIGNETKKMFHNNYNRLNICK